MSPLQADELFACLDRHGVLYVLVGGLAAALLELDARIRTPDAAEGVSFSRDAAFLGRVELLNLLTPSVHSDERMNEVAHVRHELGTYRGLTAPAPPKTS